jgi:phage gp29-like protein
MSALTRIAWQAAKAIGFAPAIYQRARLSQSAMVGRAIPDLALWHQFQRIGGAITPTQVSTILREADAGDMTRLMDLGNDARQKDGHLQAILSQAEEGIAGLDWQLRLPDGAKARDKRAAKVAESYLRSAKNFQRMISHQAGAIYYGRAITETAWQKRDGFLVPGDFVNHAARRFVFRQSDGKLVWKDPGMVEVDFLEEFPGKFIVSQPRVNGDVPCREGLIRVIVWAAMFRNWDLTDWLRTGEASWKPWRIGYHDPKANDEDKESLEAALSQLTTSGYAMLPKSTEMKIEWPGGTSQSSKSTHSELFNVIAQEMSKAVLGQTETVQSSNSSGYAQAKVHERVGGTLLKSRAKSVAADITRDLVQPFIEWNFGKGYEVPRFEFITQDPVDIGGFADAISKLVGSGLNISQEWVRDQIGAPEPIDGQDVMGADVDPAAEQEAPEAPQSKPEPPPEEGEPEDDEDAA